MNTSHERLVKMNINWPHYASVMEAKQYHDGAVKIAKGVKTVIGFKKHEARYITLPCPTKQE